MWANKSLEVPEQDQHNDNTGRYLSLVPLLDEELKVINGCQERENYFLLRRNSNIMCPMSSCHICIHGHTDNAKWTQEVIYTDVCVCLCIHTLVYKCINNTLERDCGSLNKNGTYRLICFECLLIRAWHYLRRIRKYGLLE